MATPQHTLACRLNAKRNTVAHSFRTFHEREVATAAAAAALSELCQPCACFSSSPCSRPRLSLRLLDPISVFSFVATMETNCNHHSSHRTAYPMRCPFSFDRALLLTFVTPVRAQPVRQVAAFADGFRLRGREVRPPSWPRPLAGAHVLAFDTHACAFDTLAHVFNTLARAFKLQRFQHLWARL